MRHAALWDIVKDQLHAPAVRLSGGQQQRLCIARALAVYPEILLMDEPCSALDPIATAKIEDLITALSPEVTIVLVTHNMFQAARVADRAAVFLLGDDRVGELVETGPTAEVFTSPFKLTDDGLRRRAGRVRILPAVRPGPEAGGRCRLVRSTTTTRQGRDDGSTRAVDGRAGSRFRTSST